MLARLLILATLSLALVSANAGRFDTIDAKCKQLTPAKDAVQCTTGTYMDQPTLFIKLLAKPNDQAARIERARSVIGTLTRDFYNVGGAQIQMRSTNKAGKAIERLCARTSRNQSGSCGDWYEIAETK
jgi:hypothetical protein